MPGNSFGHSFRVTTFGESHGAAIGCIVDGCPAGLQISVEEIQIELDRRKPGRSQHPHTSPRQEPDQVQILSGIFEGKTLGTPIALLIHNKDARSEDYEALRNVHRPGHADATYDAKYGHRDHRGGGRASGRETAARVAAGAIAKKFLAAQQIQITSTQLSPTNEEVEAAAQAGNGIGGEVQINAAALPAGLGEPVFDKLSADLAKAMISIPGSQNFHLDSGTAGGISTGENLQIRVSFKAPSSTKNAGIHGRHDICYVPRVLPVCEAMMAITLADHFLRNRMAHM